MKTRSWLMAALLGAASCANCPCQRDDSCVGDSDCVAGEVCRGEQCVARGRACLVDDECETDRACINGYCEVAERVVRDAGPPDAGAPECDFGEQACADGTHLRVCAVGRWDTVDCARNGLVCVNDGCRAPACGTATTRCVDLFTLETCANGTLTDCDTDETCWSGACGKSTGEPCTAGNTCAGGFCHCGGGACDGGALAQGYCSMQDCNTDGGNPCPATDVCMGLASAGGGLKNLCGQKATADCPESTSGQAPGYAGPFKRWFPVPDPADPTRYTFEDPVCFEGNPRPVGATCAGPTDCIGGATTGYNAQCLAFGGSVPGGYCTHACDQNHPCPPGTACANRPGTDPAGAGVCLLKCSNQAPGLATCLDRTGLSCRMPGGTFALLDGRTDPLGFCFSN